MVDNSSEETVKVRARSPGRYPILVVEIAGGELRCAYLETGYDLGRAKTVQESWMRENAIGRHGFVGMDPAPEMPASALEDYARRELIR